MPDAGALTPLVRTVGLSKTYEATAPGTPSALEGVDITIRHGEFVAVMGPSGSGKSTFMNILGLLDSPSRGRYELNGQNVAALNAGAAARVRNQALGFVFQSFNLLPRVSVLDNVALPLIYGGIGAAARRRRARELLAQLGLVGYEKRRPNQLSGGQQQRVAIARALVGKPQLLLADEPTGNLDTQTSNEIMALLQALNRDQGLTIVLVTHEMDIARYAQRLIRFRDGRLVEDVPMQAAAKA